MKQRLLELIRADKSTKDYGAAVKAEFGLSPDRHYDLLVVAPGWKPTKLLREYDVEVVCTAEHSYISGYEVRGEGFLMAWIQCSPGACSLIDELSVCAMLDVDRLAFVGAVGSLVPELPLGTLCTPAWSVSGNLANGYLLEDVRAYQPFGRVYPNDPGFVARTAALARELGFDLWQEPVFSTDSVFCEYAHMDFIKSFGVRLIEMETSSFYLIAELMEKPAVALLAVSDNSATGDPLLARTAAQKTAYDHCRRNVIPKLLFAIAKME